LLVYEASLKAYRDNYSAMKTAISEGEAKGRVEGRTEGRSEREIEIARNMKRDGVGSDVIAKYTGLSPEEIERLQ